MVFPQNSNQRRPILANYKLLVGVGVLLILVRIALGGAAVQSAAVESSTLMDLINHERQQRNLTTLLTHQSLVTAAGQKSQDMIDRDYFAHTDPDGNYVWNNIVAAGYTPYKVLGENLAIDFSTSEGMVKAWIDSPTHRDNLLHPDFIHQGLVALYGDYNGRFTNLTTSLFGALVSETTPPPAPPLQPEPEPQPVAPGPPASTPEEPVDTFLPETPETSQDQPATSTPPRNIGFNAPAFPITTGTPTPATGFQGFDLSGPKVIRTVFIAFALGFLVVLGVDSVVIYRRRIVISRGHPSYHFFILFLVALVFALIWFWR